MNNRFVSKIFSGLFLFVISISFFSCGSDSTVVPEITEMGSTNYLQSSMDFDSDADDLSLVFETNTDWSITVPEVESGEVWCSATPSSGKSGTNTVTIRVKENTGYDDRNVTLTLQAGTLTKKLVVTQKQKNALTLTTDKFEVTPEGGIINVEVKANIDYQIFIPGMYKDWISETSTKSSKGLTSVSHSFQIAGAPDKPCGGLCRC